MKTTVIIIFVCLSLMLTAQNNYKVIKVNGQILIEDSGKELATGVVFDENKKLDFKTPNSKAVVINSVKGQMVLTASSDGSGSNYLPAMSNISMRKGVLMMNSIDLINHFKGNIVLLDKIELPISEEAFPMNDNNFFFIRYVYKSEVINKKLTYDENYLVIDKKELLKIDGKPILKPDDNKIQLYYMMDESSQLMAEFTLMLPEEISLKQEVEVILEELKEKPKAFKIDEVKKYLNSFYGKADEEDLKGWLFKHFTIE